MFCRFAKECLLQLKTKEEQAQAIIWFHIRKTSERDVDLSTINAYFQEASLPKMNVTRAKSSFARSKKICRGERALAYKLTLPAMEEFDSTYGYLWKTDPPIKDVAGIFETPYLSDEEIHQAQKMGELYVILNCYENSARKLISELLRKKFGDTWWGVAANSAQRQKVLSRQETEKKHQWLTPRGDNPLYYLDWGDLLSIMRKYETDFLPYIKDMKFAELRFEELERVRNITAHNGYLAENDDFQRVVLSFKDWCRQVKP